MAIDPTENPFDLFNAWFDEAQRSEPDNPNAMALATVGPDGAPSIRMVLLKGVDDGGFVFYTNLESRKGVELLANGSAALCFHWKSLRRQVRVEGPATLVPDEEADSYFASRPRGSQIGAWASAQSRPMSSKADLLKDVAAYTAKFGIGRVPRPPHWSGFRITPERLEFWRDGQFRLHDRLIYLRDGGGWSTQTLYP
ncbi:MAG: pyridoxamine 5'-phosphate oxidase [Bauldia litoralis]